MSNPRSPITSLPAPVATTQSRAYSGEANRDATSAFHLRGLVLQLHHGDVPGVHREVHHPVAGALYQRERFASDLAFECRPEPVAAAHAGILEADLTVEGHHGTGDGAHGLTR